MKCKSCLKEVEELSPSVQCLPCVYEEQQALLQNLTWVFKMQTRKTDSEINTFIHEILEESHKK